MSYWKTPKEMGLDHNQVTEIAEELWNKEIEDSTRFCPDCGADPGKKHLPGCDIARCQNCKGQAISCGCGEELIGEDIWYGLWPGTKECYENKLITTHDGVNWMFDYNAVIIKEIKN